ncbi:MAG: N(4)-(beta-N-acetylglucosaminyl)-L-asparaginase [Deferribacteres bacterium]|nr:N(4)-(beta-N-acetylglucosaminyl)-L-asparaginase [candidate division KSB1 bacterium]MCB9502481.1 N(4)-(beta-N-acetylglucosaminyl)-L-asparaginase [Deferribacteres bacterium]
MTKRRDFLKLSALAGAAALTPSACKIETPGERPAKSKKSIKPIVISTWQHGMAANKAAWDILVNKGAALDAVEAGVRVTESDPLSTSVGFGGLPDRDGKVTLDACIMDHKNQCGAVAFLQDIENPISVARKVMEDTPHVMLVGEGALQFALEKGFPHKNLLTDKAEKAWKEWLKKSNYQPVINRENHDTIGMLAIDANGNLAGACTTSGMAYKLHGRVGDSPIIGAGLFVDNEVGAACATGVGEAVIRTAGSAIIVEMMRNGMSPAAACKEAVLRVMKKHSDLKNLQVGFLALNRNGEYGAYSIYKGFNFALRTDTEESLVNAKFELTNA